MCDKLSILTALTKLSFTLTVSLFLTVLPLLIQRKISASVSTLTQCSHRAAYGRFFRVNDVLDFYTDLAKKGKNMQFIVITGHNKKLYEKLEKEISKLETEKNTKLLYFVNNVEDYMHISDIIVTKPGGLTVTESLACKLPLAIYSAFPGQERENADFS